MKIVLIADGHPREWPILQAISRRFPDTIWIQPTYGGNGTAQERLPIARRFSRWYRRNRDRYRKGIMILKHRSVTFHFNDKITLPWHELGSKRGSTLLDQIAPDLIVTCRAPLLPNDILDKASWGGINVHFGTVPHYRGNEGLFWAALKSDTEGLGGSIHRLDEGLDTGSVLAHVYPSINGYELFSSVESGVSRSLAAALVKCLEEVQRRRSLPEGSPQGQEGRNWRGRERTPGSDIRCFLNRLLHRLPLRPERVDFFLDGDINKKR